MESRRDTILATVSDLVTNFVYYDRKEDEDLPEGQIEAAIDAGELSIDEIVERFRSDLTARVAP